MWPIVQVMETFVLNCPPPPPIIIRSVVSLDQLSTLVFKERLCGNGTVGAAKPTNQPGTPPPHGDWLHLPPSTVNNMVVSSISEGASLTLHFLTCGYYGYMFNTRNNTKT